MERKHFNLRGIALFMLFSGFLASCSHSNDDNPTPGGNPPASGAWHVSYFFDKKDDTGNYNGYTFEFGNSGSISATKGGQAWTGTWTTGFDDSHNKFLIDFTGNPPSALLDLEEDWLIIEQTNDFMHFEHTSGGNGDTDVLKFTKN